MPDTDYEQDLITRIIARLKREAKYANGSRFTYNHSLYWPTANEAQLARTEAKLGFPLPDFLWRIYREVANGGFGPALSIIGGQDGAPHAAGWYRNIMDAYSHTFMQDYDFEMNSGILLSPPPLKYVSLYKISSARSPHVRFALPLGTWPQFLLPFCYWGCNTEHAIHAMSGEVFVVIDGCCFVNWAPSLQVWFERWLDGSLEQE